MPHVFQVSVRIHIRCSSGRHATIRRQNCSLSDAVAAMVRAKDPPAQTVPPEGAVLI